MSEHISVSGRVKYHHLAYRKLGFSWCKRCKKFADRLNIYFDEGFLGDSIKVECGRCGKTIFVAETTEKTYARDNIKCSVCGKKISQFDAWCISYETIITASKKENKKRVLSQKENKKRVYCSEKCEKKEKGKQYDGR
jgi:ribosomal protein S27E